MGLFNTICKVFTPVSYAIDSITGGSSNVTKAQKILQKQLDQTQKEIKELSDEAKTNKKQIQENRQAAYREINLDDKSRETDQKIGELVTAKQLSTTASSFLEITQQLARTSNLFGLFLLPKDVREGLNATSQQLLGPQVKQKDEINRKIVQEEYNLMELQKKLKQVRQTRKNVSMESLEERAIELETRLPILAKEEIQHENDLKGVEEEAKDNRIQTMNRMCGIFALIGFVCWLSNPRAAQ